MATCKDCINYNDCIKRGDLAAINLTEDSERKCDLFKNKDDFVEVVRCRNCEKRIGESITGETFCLIHEVSVPYDYYCASGERRSE